MNIDKDTIYTSNIDESIILTSILLKPNIHIQREQPNPKPKPNEKPAHNQVLHNKPLKPEHPLNLLNPKLFLVVQIFQWQSRLYKLGLYCL